MMDKDRKYTIIRTLIFGFILITGCIGIPLIFRLKKHYSEGALNTQKLKGKYLIICNHRDWTDVPILCLIYYKTCLRFLSTKKIFTNRFTSGLLYAMGAIPVDKENIDFSPMNHLISLLKTGNPCVIFPEGRINQSNEIGKFKDGAGMVAALSQAAVIPHYISKLRVFRKTHIVIGKQIYYTDYFNTYTAANVTAFTSILQNEVKQLKENLEEELWQKKNTSIKQ